MRQLALSLGERSYNIYIESGLLSNSALITRYCIGESVLILSNDVVAPLYLEKLKSSLKDKNVFHLTIPDGESFKSLESYTKVLDFLIKNSFRRNDTLIALGGGVIGDLGGFVAASYQRGMGFIQCPTTLLAQVDSSVGGKTAVNHPLGKNMIGAFYQPLAVFIDMQTLDTLPEKEYFSGFAEIVKYAMLGAAEIKQLFETKLSAIQQRDPEVVAELIYYSCAKKAEVVSADEREAGSRALLNLGHTFGHAIERLTNYQHYLHGEAISIGIMMAMNLSKEYGDINNETYAFYHRLLLALNLPVIVDKPIAVSDMMSTMKLDKKNLNSKYRFVLPKDDHCFITELQASELIEQSIAKQIG